MKQQRMVDLSYRISGDMVVYPGMERPVFQWVYRANSEGANLTKFTMMVHTGTHVDAPKHFKDEMSTIDEVAIERFFGRARVFRYSQDLHGQEIQLDEVFESGFDLEEDTIFVVATGIERYAETAEYNKRFPVPSEELLQWLIDRKIRCYMTDAPAIDPVATKNSEKHHLLLGADVPLVENLCNLSLLPEDRHFLISAFPIKLGGREGAPCRAVAFPDIENL
jgi:arylformamidase